jgi:hypothetical protein
MRSLHESSDGDLEPITVTLSPVAWSLIHRAASMSYQPATRAAAAELRLQVMRPQFDAIEAAEIRDARADYLEGA